MMEPDSTLARECIQGFTSRAKVEDGKVLKENDADYKKDRSSFSFSNAQTFSLFLQMLGFGFFLAWIWIGLYEGYPCFQSGYIDSLAVATLFTGFFTAVILAGFFPRVRQKMPKGGVLVAGISACISSGICVLVQSSLELFGEVGVLWIIRGLCLIIGAGTSLIMLGFGTRFSCFEPRKSFLVFCGSFAAAFFGFFAVKSFDYPLSEIVFSVFPVVSSLCLWDRVAPIPPREEFVACGDAEKNNEQLQCKYARGFVQMVIAFGVFTFAASLTQSFEPQKDFALGIDEGWVGFALLLAVIAWLLLSQRVGTFKVLKLLYQAAIVLMVIRLVLQPLLVDDSIFAALNMMTYLTLFLVFWPLTAFVGHVGEVEAVKAYAIVFALAAVCMGFAWVLGSHLYTILGHDRLYLSIAAGCVVAVFCTFGFSVRNFPYLTHAGKGYQQASATETEIAVDVNAANSAAPRPSLNELIAGLSDEYALTPREAEIFELLAEGRTAEEIAEDLVISYYTVRTHIRNLYSKLGAGSRSELLLIVSKRERSIGSMQRERECKN